MLLKICFVTISKRKLLINETIKKINSKLNTLHEGPITSSHRFKGHFLTLKASHTQNCWHILSTLVCLFNQPITRGLLWHSHNHVNKLVVLLHMAINYYSFVLCTCYLHLAELPSLGSFVCCIPLLTTASRYAAYTCTYNVASLSSSP